MVKMHYSWMVFNATQLTRIVLGVENNISFCDYSTLLCSWSFVSLMPLTLISPLDFSVFVGHIWTCLSSIVSKSSRIWFIDI